MGLGASTHVALAFRLLTSSTTIAGVAFASTTLRKNTLASFLAPRKVVVRSLEAK